MERHAHGPVSMSLLPAIKGPGILSPLGSVRLRGGLGESEGLVEVWARGAWGAICSGHWDDAAATVVCHQLQPG